MAKVRRKAKDSEDKVEIYVATWEDESGLLKRSKN